MSGAENAAAAEPELYYEDEEDEDDSSSGLEPSDSSSVCSEDSVYPPSEPPHGAGGPGELSLYQCCVRNDAQLLRERLRCGVGRGEATELDINGRVSGGMWGGGLEDAGMGGVGSQIHGELGSPGVAWGHGAELGGGRRDGVAAMGSWGPQGSRGAMRQNVGGRRAGMAAMGSWGLQGLHEAMGQNLGG